VATLSAVAGPLALQSDDERRFLREAYIPWALRCGRRARPLMSVWYEQRFDCDLDDLRKELRIERAPQYQEKRDNINT
jgi:ubiquinone biosynthesis protein COQ4